MSMTIRKFQVFEALSFAFLQPPDIPVHKKRVTLNKGHALFALVHEMRHASLTNLLISQRSDTGRSRSGHGCIRRWG